jgi:hypothetical protein
MTGTVESTCNAGTLHVFETAFRIPGVGLHFAKDAIAFHHPRAANIAMLEPNETGVAVFLVQIGPVAREDVGVEIDLQGK